MRASEPDTEELLRLAQAGDQSAVQPLLMRHRDRLRRMVRFRMDERLTARFDPSDVVQETFVHAVQKLPRYLSERPLPFYPWLRQIAWDRLIELHRRHLHAAARTVCREADWPVSGESMVLFVRQLAAAGSSSPSRHAVRKEVRDRVRQALQSLPATDREVLLLRHLEQLRVSEVAAVLGISESAAKSRLRRALERLQDLLGADFTEEWP